MAAIGSPQIPNAAAKSNVSVAASSTAVLAANPGRLGATIWNDSAVVVYVDYSGGTASATSCSVKMAADAYLEIPYGYTGAITHIGASASGTLRVTELT